MPKRLILSLLTLLITVSVSASAEEWRKTYSVSGKPDIRVETNDGEIQVATADRKDIEVVVTTDRYKIGNGGVTITDHQVGDRLDIDVHIPSYRHFVSINFHSRSVRIQLNIPRQANLATHSGDGRITARDVNGNMVLRSGDGDIEVDNAKGNLEIETGDGRVECRHVEGQLKAETHDGDVRIDGVFSALEVKTGDGKIEAVVASGSKMSSSWSARSGDGSITVTLPDGFSADLDAHTGDGHISVDLPVTVQGSVRENEIRGKMNGGGQILEIRSGDGNISLRRS